MMGEDKVVTARKGIRTIIRDILYEWLLSKIALRFAKSVPFAKRPCLCPRGIKVLSAAAHHRHHANKQNPRQFPDGGFFIFSGVRPADFF